MRLRRSWDSWTTPNGRSTICRQRRLIPNQNYRTEERGKKDTDICHKFVLAGSIRFSGQSGAFAIFRPTPPNHRVRTVRLDRTESKMSRNEYTLHYHGGIPGRGEFVRLAFEYTGTPYRVGISLAPTPDLLTCLCTTG